ncbi:MAG: 3-dehydroquinate synthase, partial [Deltaproteobacteria bacterium]|nr:3-dehydroquinate synthase [Deltaproteobacteria bacterium]
GFTLYVPQLDQRGAILQGLDDFRVHLGGRLSITLLWDIGQGMEAHDIDQPTVRAALDLLRRIAAEDSEQLAVSG